MAFYPSVESKNIYDCNISNIRAVISRFPDNHRFYCSDLFSQWGSYSGTVKSGLGKLLNNDVDTNSLPGVSVYQEPIGREPAVYIYRFTKAGRQTQQEQIKQQQEQARLRQLQRQQEQARLVQQRQQQEKARQEQFRQQQELEEQWRQFFEPKKTGSFTPSTNNAFPIQPVETDPFEIAFANQNTTSSQPEFDIRVELEMLDREYRKYFKKPVISFTASPIPLDILNGKYELKQRWFEQESVCMQKYYNQIMMQEEAEEQRRQEYDKAEQIRLQQVNAERQKLIKSIEDYISPLDNANEHMKQERFALEGNADAIARLGYWYFYRRKDVLRAYYLYELSPDIEKNWQINNEILDDNACTNALNKYPDLLTGMVMHQYGAIYDNKTRGMISGRKKIKELLQQYAKKYVDLERKAAGGRAEAQYNLGVEYLKHYISINDAYAFELFNNSYEQGYYEAAERIGYMHYEGIGVSNNDFLALEWFNKAANAGSVAGAYRLGICYFHGHGCSMDASRAKEQFEIVRKSKNDEIKKELFSNYIRSLTGVWTKKAGN